MTNPPFQVTCLGLPDPWTDAVVQVASDAEAALGLSGDFSGLRLCADDLPGSGNAWYRVGPGTVADAAPVLVLFCHRDCFGPAARPGGAVDPPRPVWEQTPAPPSAAGSPVVFDAERAAVFLHHHLLMARDLVRGDIVGRNLPAALAEAFTEAWAVTVDGRLARQGLPGFPLAERRGRFALVFSPAGILLPDHWQVFQSLWDGALQGQKEVLDVVKRLPGL
jgi:hypothetical protein